MRTTKRACEDLAKREAPNRREVHWDDEVRGFGVRLNAPGRLSFVLKYRVKGDPKQRYIAMGEWPGVAPDNVRREAAGIKMAAANGRDLVAERRAETASATRARQDAERRAIPLPQVLDGWRAAIESEIAKKAGERRSVRYERELLHHEAKTLRPALAGETVGGMDPDLFQAIVAAQATPSNARNVRAALVRFIRHARISLLLQGIKVSWPVAFEVKGKVQSRRSRYTIESAARVYIAAGRLGRRGALVRWLLLTACRRAEVQKMQRSHLDLADPTLGPNWFQPGKLTKNGQSHRVPLSPPVPAALHTRPAPARRRSAGRGVGLLPADLAARKAAPVDLGGAPPRGTRRGGVGAAGRVRR